MNDDVLLKIGLVTSGPKKCWRLIIFVFKKKKWTMRKMYDRKLKEKRNRIELRINNLVSVKMHRLGRRQKICNEWACVGECCSVCGQVRNMFALVVSN